MSKSDLGAGRHVPAVWRYGLSVLCVAICTAVTFPLQSFGVRVSLFFPAVLLTTWFGGTGPGLLAVLLSTLSINFFFTEPFFAFEFSVQDIPTTVAFLFSALLISSWSTARKRAENRLRQSQYELRKARDELESKVKERTADLSHSNEALRENEEKYRGLIETSPDAIFVTDVVDGNCVMSNPAGAALAGYPEDELIGTSIIDTYVPEERYLFQDRIEKLKTEGSSRLERKFVRRNGEVVPVEVSVSMLGGRYLQAVVRDISERKRAEALLTGEKRLLEMIATDFLDSVAGPSLAKEWTQQMEKLPIGPCAGSCGTAAYRGSPVIVSDIATDPLWDAPEHRTSAMKHGLRASWSNPVLSSEGKVLGTFCMYYRETRNPSSQDVELIGLATHLVQLAIERDRAEEALRASEQVARGQVEALTYSLDVLATAPAPDKFIGQMLSMIGRLLSAQSVTLWLFDEATDSLVLRSMADAGKLAAPDAEHPFIKDPLFWKQNPAIQELLFTAGPVVCEDIDTDPRVNGEWREYLKRRGAKRFLAVPLLVGEQVRGFVGIRHSDRVPYRPEEIGLTQALAHQVMLAIQLNEFAEQGQRAAVFEERNRMARDIHDTLAQGFTGVIVQLEAADDAISCGCRKEAYDHLHRAGELARLSLSEARRSVHALRPQALQEHNFWDALKGIIKNTTVGTALHTKFEAQGKLPELPRPWQENLLHIGQEALTNTLKYAHASNFETRLSYKAKELCLEIRDDGDGFKVKDRHDGAGLTGMRERVEQMGGALKVTSTPRKGTRITVVVPYNKESVS